MQLLRLLALSILLFSGCSKKQDVKITETDSEQGYWFVADYNEEETVPMQQLMNQTLKPNRIFVDHEDPIDKEIRLADGTIFHLKSTPGDLSIHIDKKNNSVAALDKVKKMCSEIRKLVGGE